MRFLWSVGCGRHFEFPKLISCISSSDDYFLKLSIKRSVIDEIFGLAAQTQAKEIIAPPSPRAAKSQHESAWQQQRGG